MGARAQDGTSTSVTNTEVREEQCVAANDLLVLIRDKWTILVLGALSHADTLRYTELHREVIGISQRMLTLTLKTLEQNGLVTRTSWATVPPRVDYQLTGMGRSVGPPLVGLLQWALANGPAMAEARRAYATRPGGAAPPPAATTA